MSALTTETKITNPPANAFLPKVDFAILSAMPEELEFFKKTFSDKSVTLIQIGNLEFAIYEYQNKLILITHTGMGTTFAASITALVDSYFNPDYFFFSGTAGGIKPGLKLRDVVIVTQAFEAEIQGVFHILKGTPFENCLKHPLNQQFFPSLYPADEELLATAQLVSDPSITIHTGTAVSSNTFPAPQELFTKIKSMNPYSIDMETSAIYQYCWLRQKKAIAFRGISNILSHDGSDDNIHQSDLYGSAQAAATIMLKTIDKLIQKIDAQQNNNTVALTTIPKEYITSLNLLPHPEGGYFSQTFKSQNLVTLTNSMQYKDNATRPACTSIYYMLIGKDFSAWHSIKSDESWYYHKGSAVKIHIIDSEGTLKTIILGDKLSIKEANFSVTVKAGNWFAAELMDKSAYGLVSCSVSPGFEYRDYVIVERNFLLEHFPQHKNIIIKLTRTPLTTEEKNELFQLDSAQTTKACKTISSAL